MAFNFFIRKKDIQEQVEPPKNNLIDADLLLVQIGLMHETYFSVAKTRAAKVSREDTAGRLKTSKRWSGT